MRELPSTYTLLGTIIILLYINYTYFKYGRFMDYPRAAQMLVWFFLMVILSMCGVIILNILFLT